MGPPIAGEVGPKPAWSRSGQHFQEDFAMLILSRHVNERIVIGDDIVVTVVEIRGDRVRLGIDAPQEVRVDREEIRDRIMACQEAQ